MDTCSTLVKPNPNTFTRVTLPTEIRTPTTVAVWSLLTRRRLAECWDSTAALAERIGRSIRTVQLALKRLADAGLIVVKLVRSRTGPGAKSGHRILFCDPADPSSAQSVAPSSAQSVAPSDPSSAQSIAPRTPPPSDSPYKEPNGKLIENNNDESREPSEPESSLSFSVPSLSSDPDPDPAPEPTPTPQESPQAAPEAAEPLPPLEVRELRWKASEAFPDDAYAARQAEALTERYPVAWVSAALDAAMSARKRDGAVGTGYVIRTLAAYQAAGAAPRPKMGPIELMTPEELAPYLDRIMEGL